MKAIAEKTEQLEDDVRDALETLAGARLTLMLFNRKHKKPESQADSHIWQTNNPPVAGYYLTTDKVGFVNCLYFDGVGWFEERWPTDSVIAWMDKPEGYKPMDEWSNLEHAIPTHPIGTVPPSKETS